jgi:hypothetical protein
MGLPVVYFDPFLKIKNKHIATRTAPVTNGAPGKYIGAFSAVKYAKMEVIISGPIIPVAAIILVKAP